MVSSSHSCRPAVLWWHQLCGEDLWSFAAQPWQRLDHSGHVWLRWMGWAVCNFAVRPWSLSFFVVFFFLWHVFFITWKGIPFIFFNCMPFAKIVLLPAKERKWLALRSATRSHLPNLWVAFWPTRCSAWRGTKNSRLLASLILQELCRTWSSIAALLSRTTKCVLRQGKGILSSQKLWLAFGVWSIASSRANWRRSNQSTTRSSTPKGWSVGMLRQKRLVMTRQRSSQQNVCAWLLCSLLRRWIQSTLRGLCHVCAAHSSW